MSAYTQRVADNILPKSVAGALPDAFKEWYFTEEVEDHGKSEEYCELCDQEQLRYHFQIKNRHTNHCLWVGSSCILKFQVQVFENNVLLDASRSAKKLRDLTKKMRLDACITALRELAVSENNPILSNALDYYQRNKYLTPKFAFVVLWRLKEHNIDHSPSFFTINLQRESYKADLAGMTNARIHLIWPALKSNQRKLAESYGHKKPGTT